jgi:hypothetical protein
LDILGEEELALELPWGRRQDRDYDELLKASDIQETGERSSLTQSVQEQIAFAKSSEPDSVPFLASSGLLALYIANEKQNDVARKLAASVRTPDAPVEAVMAYGAYVDFQVDQKTIESPAAGVSSQSYAMFGWEFFVPEGTGETDHELLRKATKLAARSDFRETRQYFHGWLKQMYEGDVGRDEACDKMLKMLGEYTAIARGSGLKMAIRYIAKVAAVAAPAAALISPLVGVIGGVGANAANLIVGDVLAPKPIPHRLRPAALVHDAYRFFGKH